MNTQTNTLTTDEAAFDSGTAGRVLYAVPFLAFGVMHFLQGGALAAVVPSWLPGGAVWVYLTGAANLVAGIAIVANRLVRPTALALVGLLGAYVLTVHLPGLFADGSFQIALQSLLKDVGLAGGALLLVGQSD